MMQSNAKKYPESRTIFGKKLISETHKSDGCDADMSREEGLTWKLRFKNPYINIQNGKCSLEKWH